MVTLPAWGAASWVLCPYWATAHANAPREETPDRTFGLCAHALAADMLRGVPVQEGQPIAGFVGQFATFDMIDAATMYADDVREASKGQPVYLETPLQMTGRLAPVNIIKPDCFAWLAADHLVLWEFKAGREFVPAFSNWQMMTYVRGILDAFQIDGLREQVLTVEFRVVQPRNYDREGHVRTWTVTASNLRSFWNVLENAADDATGEDPVARAGASQCKRCVGRAKCGANQRQGFQVATLAGDGSPLDMSGWALGRELQILRDARAILDARVTGLEEEAKAKILKGEAVEGFVAERRQGKLSWSVGNNEVKMIGDLHGVSLVRETPITPTQAITAGIPADVVNAYASRGVTDYKLITSDKSEVRRIFGQNTTE